MPPAASLAKEDAIVWVRDVSSLPFVRERFERCVTKVGHPFPESGDVGRDRLMRQTEEVIGYADLKPSAMANGRGFFLRRVFSLKPYDKGGQAYDHPIFRRMKLGRTPKRGVDPATVSVGVAGVPV